MIFPQFIWKKFKFYSALNMHDAIGIDERWFSSLDKRARERNMTLKSRCDVAFFVVFKSATFQRRILRIFSNSMPTLTSIAKTVLAWGSVGNHWHCRWERERYNAKQYGRDNQWRKRPRYNRQFTSLGTARIECVFRDEKLKRNMMMNISPFHAAPHTQLDSKVLFF